MTQPTRWNTTRGRSSQGSAGAKRRRSSVPTFDALEDRVVMSTSAVPATPAAEILPLRAPAVAPVVQGYQTASSAVAVAAAAADAHTPLGNGIGAKQVVVENWGGVPFVYMINTNDELYYGYQTVQRATTAPWGTYTSFSGWTFVTGAAKQITVDMSRGSVPYVYMINTNNDLYYGSLKFSSSGSLLQPSSFEFSDWTFVTGAAKDVVVSSWQGDTYLYLTNTNNELYFGFYYTKPGATFPPVPSDTLFSGWGFVTGAVKSVDVTLWRSYPYLFLINTNDDLYYANLYYTKGTLASSSHVAVTDWAFITGAASSVDVTLQGGNPRLYLINWNSDLYYGDLIAASSDELIPPGPSKFGAWNYLTGGASQIIVDQWQGQPYYYLINTNDELYYGYWTTTYTETSRWVYTPSTAFSGWNFLTGAARNLVVNQWQNNPFLYLTNSLDDLYFGNLFAGRSNVAPWNSFTAFSGWSPF